MRNLYRREGIALRKPGFKFTSKRSDHEIKQLTTTFVSQLAKLMKAGEMVAYMDETSTHR